jgi:hypothetical protein
MKPIDVIIEIQQAHPDWCIWCHNQATRIPEREILFTTDGFFFCHNPKLISSSFSSRTEPCTKDDWDRCPYNK